MHCDQPPYNNKRPCNVLDYHWRLESGVDMIGLPTTRAGTPYIPDTMGQEWRAIEGDATMIEGVYHHIDLIFRNRKEDIWRAATRSAYEF